MQEVLSNHFLSNVQVVQVLHQHSAVVLVFFDMILPIAKCSPCLT